MERRSINDGNALKMFVKSLINERLRVSQGDDVQDTQVTSDKSDEQNDVVDVNAIVDKLNSIRSGRSFRDSAVEERMNAFFGALGDSEKKALYQFLCGIAQAVTGEVPTETVIKSGDPSGPPANVQMSQKDAKKEVQGAKLSLKPNVVKGDIDDEERHKEDVEDTTPPAPINPKKRR